MIVMRKTILVGLISILGAGQVLASPYLRKPQNSFTANSVLVTGATSSDSMAISDITYDSTNGTVLTGDLRTSKNVGTAGAATVTATEDGFGKVHVTTLTLANFVLPAVASQGANGDGALLYTLPAGAQIVEHARLNVGIFADNGQVQSDTPDVGIGSVIATGAVSVLSGTATFEDILTGQTMDDVNGTVEKAIGVGSDFTTDTSGAKTIYLNRADTFANGSNLHANGTVIIPWIFLD